jgi:hypothetical protein
MELLAGVMMCGRIGANSLTFSPPDFYSEFFISVSSSPSGCE